MALSIKVISFVFNLWLLVCIYLNIYLKVVNRIIRWNFGIIELVILPRFWHFCHQTDPKEDLPFQMDLDSNYYYYYCTPCPSFITAHFTLIGFTCTIRISRVKQASDNTIQEVGCKSSAVIGCWSPTLPTRAAWSKESVLYLCVLYLCVCLQSVWVWDLT